MNGPVDSRNDLITKWLRVLMYIAIVSLVNSVINFLPFVPAAATTWVSRGIMAAMIICMFRMAPIHPRYRKAGIYRGVMLALTLITSLLFASSFLTLAASVFSIMAVYQEYSAHSELVADKDPRLSGNWHSLFNWSILVGVLVSFGSFVAVLLVSLLETDAVWTASIIIGVLRIPQLVMDVVYLLYLKKMIQIFPNEGEVYNHAV